MSSQRHQVLNIIRRRNTPISAIEILGAVASSLALAEGRSKLHLDPNQNGCN